MKAYGGVYVQLHALAALLHGERIRGTHWPEGSVGRSAGVDIEPRFIGCPGLSLVTVLTMPFRAPVPWDTDCIFHCIYITLDEIRDSKCSCVYGGVRARACVLGIVLDGLQIIQAAPVTWFKS
jgi:hypothetical protein